MWKSLENEEPLTGGGESMDATVGMKWKVPTIINCILTAVPQQFKKYNFNFQTIVYIDRHLQICMMYMNWKKND